MALSSPQFRTRASAGRNRRKSDLTPLFIPRLSEWRKSLAEDTGLAERLIRTKRWLWIGCYLVGFGSGLLTMQLIRMAAPSPTPAAVVKRSASRKNVPAVKKSSTAKQAARTPIEAPVVTIREVKR